jgi:hypothetical protein
MDGKEKGRRPHVISQEVTSFSWQERFFFSLNNIFMRSIRDIV